MPRIPSANPDFQLTNVDDPASAAGYIHPAETRKAGGIPLAFQVTSPFNRARILLPHALVMHVNPTAINETFTQKVERFQTRGGFVEQHWGSELTEISVDMSTGAFMNLYTGVTSVLRQRTIAWDRYRDLHDLYRNNGSLYDPFGAIVLQGFIMLMYDRGTYLGTFRSFETDDTDESPFAFKVSWSFKVEHTILKVSDTGNPRLRSPAFQQRNLPATTDPAGIGTPGSGTAASPATGAEAARREGLPGSAGVVAPPGASAPPTQPVPVPPAEGKPPRTGTQGVYDAFRAASEANTPDKPQR